MTEAAIMSLIVLYSNMFGFDAKVALAVAKVESNYQVNAVSKDGLDSKINPDAPAIKSWGGYF